MGIHLSGGSGCLTILAVLIVPAAATAYFLNSLKWLIIIPIGIVILALIVAALPSKRKVTPQEYAVELERHLLGTEGEWDWDDSTSIVIADPRLETLRRRLSEFDLLVSSHSREEFAEIIAKLKRGDVSEVRPDD